MANFVSTEKLRKAFLSALIGGILITWIAGLLGLKGLLLATVPISIMCIYVAWYYYETKGKTRLEEFGNSLYYLGFIFTLAALAYALARWEAVDQNTASLISALGLALLTTLFGLFLRAAILQFSVGTGESIEEASRRLREASEALTVEINSIISSLHEVSQNIETQVDTRFNSLAEHAETFIATFQEKFEQVANTLSEGIAHDIKNNLADLATTSSQLSKMVKRIEKSMEKYNNIINSTDSVFESFADGLNSVDNSTHKLAESVDSIRKTADSIADFDQAVKDNHSLMRGSIEALSLVTETLNETNSAIRQTSTIHKELEDDLRQNASEIQTARAQLSEEVKEAVSETSKLLDHLEKGTKAITNAIQDSTS